MSDVRTRFAPSPTGYMHIGNLRTGLYAYLLAKKNNGKFILRIEDTDQERLVEGAVDVIYNVLKLTGLKHDEGPDIGGDYGPYVQSQRKSIYKEYAEKLVDLGGAYYCFCSKEQIAEARGKHGLTKEGAFKYDDPCRYVSIDEARKRIENGEAYVVRQRIPKTGATAFEDAVFGSITVDNNTLDENVLLKSDGLPTYNFANVVDDHLMNISHVMRGVEYLSSTPKYNLLYNAFGWEIPTYIHLPHIIKEGGKKLSKREGDASFEDFYKKGYLIEAIINYIALLGWNPGTDQEIFSLKELEEQFGIDGLSKSSAMFDVKKLNWMNSEYIKKMDIADFHKMALPYYEKVITNKNIDLLKISALMHTRTDVFNNIPENIDFFDSLPDYDINMYVHKKMKTDLENSLEYLKASYDALKDLSDWTEEGIDNALKALIEKLGVKNGQVLWPVRTAISGKQMTPGGAIEIADILGKEETLKRMQMGIKKLS
ncbi:glutamate--tRNA ligase [Oxobacter pfennigii]|uniref:Glutamate--tRNA ligase n=1 Tax=Oxobacter pfennigii TaxID=36849 RepID=A0A0P8WRT4_9CLOT|nr:glutamate--tRNA ligase [Oxobacter pfennigii]KPU45301.1 glutamate--tRNA ligase [Oxobacter pfennigii]